MATDQRTLPGTFTLDSDFRSWGSGLSAQFAAVGLVKTADTGQIDWTTVLKPSAINQQRGYEIWRFNDALQATKPVFIRIDFGSSGGAATTPGLWLTVGTGTNGAGTLTGQVSTTRQTSPSSAGAASYCSGSSSRLNLLSNGAASGTFQALCVERTKTGAGVDTGDAIVHLAASQSGGLFYGFIPFIGTIAADVAVNPALESNLGGSSVIGTDVMLSPTTVFYGKPLFASWCAYRNVDITGLTPITFTHLGAARTYMPMGFGISGMIVTGLSSYALAMLWE